RAPRTVRRARVFAVDGSKPGKATRVAACRQKAPRGSDFPLRQGRPWRGELAPFPRIASAPAESVRGGAAPLATAAADFPELFATAAGPDSGTPFRHFLAAP